MCSTATKAANDDAAGSVVYPVSSIRSIGMGSMAVTGIITGSETVYHIALNPMAINQGVGDAGVLGDNVDVINVTMTTANTAKTHMQHLIQKINSSRVTESGWIDLYDGVNATKLIADISSAANLINANA
tara:strand:- start:46 stop:435 length:390 start_codon:yes stop_codon:yes gene_type:complete